MTSCLMASGMGRDWHHIMLIFAWLIWKGSLLKCPLTPHTYYRYLDDICIIWPHSMDAFSEFLDILNTHEKPIKCKSSVCISNIDYLDNIVLKDPDNSKTWSIMVFFKPRQTPVVKQTFLSSKAHIQRFNKITNNMLFHKIFQEQGPWKGIEVTFSIFT